MANEFEGGNAPWVDVSATFGIDEVTPLGLWLKATPLFAHYQADESRFRYTQAELSFSAGVVLWDGVELTAAMSGWRRWYYGAEAEVSGHRRDWRVSGGLALMASELWLESLGVELRGEAERVWSNDELEDEDTASIGLYFHWRF